VNRETKRMLQRQGAVGADGAPVRQPRTAPAPKPKDARPSPREYLGEVQGELRKVAWPTRAEVRNYTIVVIATLAIMTALTFVFDYGFAKAILFLFDR
jgi:preprotein translocase subunit SecE